MSEQRYTAADYQREAKAQESVSKLRAAMLRQAANDLEALTEERRKVRTLLGGIRVGAAPMADGTRVLHEEYVKALQAVLDHADRLGLPTPPDSGEGPRKEQL